MKRVAELPRRIEEFSIPEPNSGCWLWLGAMTRYDGLYAYGTISIAGKSVKAHRASFEAFCHAIPAGLEVCHRCDNPICVNPDHLFVGTHLENMRDRDRKQRRLSPTGEKNGFARLTDSIVRQIRSAKGTQMQIAAQFGIDQTTVSVVRTRKRWSHVV